MRRIGIEATEQLEGSEGDRRATAGFLAGAMRHFTGRSADNLRVLDFGCGDGGLVDQLRGLGYEAMGCDFAAALGSSEYLSPIGRTPYRLPYDAESFDVVLSTSVFEHAQNTEACFREIWRVLKPGGVSMHMFPAKRSLPVEVHIRVPIVSWLWPRRVRWWLALWAILGVRNKYQIGKPWREVVHLNDRYIRDGLCYRSSAQYDEVSRRVFSRWSWPMDYYVGHAPGGAARLARGLRGRSISGRILREVRHAFLLQYKDQ